jgi:hypothetical protein
MGQDEADDKIARTAPPLWRAGAPYRPNNVSSAGLLNETRQFLRTYADVRDLAITRQQLIDGGLAQRSRATRTTLLKVIQRRLVRWAPPAWVWDDLIAFAQDEIFPSLPAALLLHVARQDLILYDVVQHLIVPRWQSGEHIVVRADVQRLFDEALPAHPEIDQWTYQTRAKLAGTMLSILRDYGLLQGTARKRIIEPIVPLPVAQHVLHLLRAEGIQESAIPTHPDWRLWLWDNGQVQSVLHTLAAQTQEVAV